MGESFREMMLETVRHKRDEIERLRAKMAEADDPDVRDGLGLKLGRLRQELAAAEKAAGVEPEPEPAEPTPGTPERQDAAATDLQPSAASAAADVSHAAAQPAQKGRSRAALEAQARELQVELFERARDAERAPLGGEKERAALAETREKLSETMRLLAEAARREAATFEGELPPAPTPQQRMEADSLLRQANVAKMRGQTQVVLDLIRRAAEIAPGSASVLELLGDDLAEKGRAKEAMETYAKALALEPDNAGVERKYGAMIMRSRGGMSADQMLMLGDSGLATEDLASRKMAMLLSVILPGLGQIVLGHTARGAALMAGWLLMLGWSMLMPDGLQSMIKALAGQPSNFNPVVLLPVLVALGIHLVSIATVGSGGRQKVDRPRPPVDLPFD